MRTTTIVTNSEEIGRVTTAAATNFTSVFDIEVNAGNQ